MSVHFPVVAAFLSSFNKARGSSQTIKKINSALRSGDFKVVMAVMGCKDLEQLLEIEEEDMTYQMSKRETRLAA